LKKKEFVDPEMVRELNEVVDKRCCICLEEMRAKTKPEECVHVFCRSCISAWTKTFSNLCPLCKVEIKWLLIYKERTDLECDQEERIDQNEDLKLHEDEIVDRIEVIKPVVNEEVNDWVESFADSCYVCEQGGDEPQLLVCDRCNFNICHTYCCGLDRIPDGDWYCRDCQ
jgi:Ring finger domain